MFIEYQASRKFHSIYPIDLTLQQGVDHFNLN